MLLKLLRKLTVDVSRLSEYTTVALRLLTLHYERCGKYYGSLGGQGNYGSASDEEKRLTMMLFSNIFDSLSKMVFGLSFKIHPVQLNESNYANIGFYRNTTRNCSVKLCRA